MGLRIAVAIDGTRLIMDALLRITSVYIYRKIKWEDIPLTWCIALFFSLLAIPGSPF